MLVNIWQVRLYFFHPPGFVAIFFVENVVLYSCESRENGGVYIWLQCFMEPECQIVILCKEISMIFPLEIKSLFRPLHSLLHF